MGLKINNIAESQVVFISICMRSFRGKPPRKWDLEHQGTDGQEAAGHIRSHFISLMFSHCKLGILVIANLH